MKNKQNDKLMKYLTKFLVAFFSVFLIYLLSFFLQKSNVDSVLSNIPVLDTVSLKATLLEIEEREDWDTGGKPDIEKFIFGNNEPF